MFEELDAERVKLLNSTTNSNKRTSDYQQGGSSKKPKIYNGDRPHQYRDMFEELNAERVKLSNSTTNSNKRTSDYQQGGSSKKPKI